MAQSNELTTEVMNEAIALFDGWKLIKGENVTCPSCDEGKMPTMYCNCHLKIDRLIKDGECRNKYGFVFHRSWDSLMPIWKRLIDTVSGQTEEGDYPVDFCSVMDMWGLACEDANIQQAHNIAYQGIKWLNQQKQKDDR